MAEHEGFVSAFMETLALLFTIAASIVIIAFLTVLSLTFALLHSPMRAIKAPFGLARATRLSCTNRPMCGCEFVFGESDESDTAAGAETFVKTLPVRNRQGQS